MQRDYDFATSLHSLSCLPILTLGDCETTTSKVGEIADYRPHMFMLHELSGHVSDRFIAGFADRWTARERREKEEAEAKKAGKKLSTYCHKQPVVNSHTCLCLTVGKRSKDKPKYAGGLVLEPKAGFYDRSAFP